MLFLLFLFSLYFNIYFFTLLFIYLCYKNKSNENIYIFKINPNVIVTYFKYINIFITLFFKLLNIFGIQFKNIWHPLTKRTSYFTFFFFCKNHSKKII